MANDPYEDYKWEDEDEDGFPECVFCGRPADLVYQGLCPECYEEWGD